MRPSQVIAEIEIILNAGLSAFIHGPPGIGKSRIIQDYCKEHNLELRDIRASQLDPVDARGIPVPDRETNVTRWFPPDFLPRSGKGIIFLDELNRANQDTQSALYQLILDRRIGDYVLPAGWSIIAAGNNDDDGCMVQPMSRALKNRFIHLEMEADYDDWHVWAHKNGVVEHVIAYMKHRPSSLDEMTEVVRDGSGKKLKQVRNSNAFATPRSWEFASDILKEAFKKGRKIKECYSLLEGTIGEGKAGEFVAYCDIYMELQDIDELIEDPRLYRKITDPSKLYALCTGLATRANMKNFSNIKKILDQMEPEYSVWTVKDCLHRNKELKTHPDYAKWVVKHIEYAV